MQAEELLRDGRLTECLEQAQDAVRSDPANAPMRIFLFQLLSVLGEWDPPDGVSDLILPAPGYAAGMVLRIRVP